MSLDRSPGQSVARVALLAICLGYFMVILDTTVVNVALVDIQRRLGAGVSGLQWIVDGYALVFASLLLTGGALGDRLGNRRIFVAGLALFTAASAVCSAAPALWALQAARAVQGIGAALMVPASLALLSYVFPTAGERSRAVGVWAAVAGVAAGGGPVVGGLLVQAFGWRSVFVVNVPVGIAAVVLTLRYVPAAPGLRQRGMDLPAQIAGVAALGLLTFACIEGGPLGWDSPVILGAFAGSLVVAALFVRVERVAGSPMLPLGLFSSRTFSAASGVGVLINFGFYAQLFCMSLYFQQVRGDSALVTGLALLAESGSITIASYLSGRVTARCGPRLPMVAGQLVGACGLLGLLLADRATPYVVLCGPLVLTGFGMAFTMPAMTSAVLDAVPGERSGIASGVLNAGRQMGGVIGVALLGSLLAGSAGFIAGLHLAMAVAAGAFLAGALLALLGVHRGRHNDPRESDTDEAPQASVA